MKNIRDMNKSQLRRHTLSLFGERNRLLEPYDCGQSLAEYMGPPRIREIRLELEAIDSECGWRLMMEATQEQRRLQQERERRAYPSRLTYNDAQERGAEHCDKCGNTDPWFPRCKEHEPIE